MPVKKILRTQDFIDDHLPTLAGTALAVAVVHASDAVRLRAGMVPKNAVRCRVFLGHPLLFAFVQDFAADDAVADDYMICRALPAAVHFVFHLLLARGAAAAFSALIAHILPAFAESSVDGDLFATVILAAAQLLLFPYSFPPSVCVSDPFFAIRYFAKNYMPVSIRADYLPWSIP